MSGTERPARIELMDALRGLAVCLMVLHHFLYDLCAFLGAPWWLPRQTKSSRLLQGGGFFRFILPPEREQ